MTKEYWFNKYSQNRMPVLTGDDENALGFMMEALELLGIVEKVIMSVPNDADEKVEPDDQPRQQQPPVILGEPVCRVIESWRAKIARLKIDGAETVSIFDVVELIDRIDAAINMQPPETVNDQQ